MNEIYFTGYGYLKVDTDNYDKAVDILLKALADVGVEFNMDEMELRDENGCEIE